MGERGGITLSNAQWDYFPKSFRELLSELDGIVGLPLLFILLQDAEFSRVIRLSNPSIRSIYLPGLHVSDFAPRDNTGAMQPVVITDTTQHAQGEALLQYGIHSYIGVPIRLSDGTIFGTLCSVDAVSHQIEQTQVSVLQWAAKMVAYVIEIELTALMDPLTGALNRVFLQRFTSNLTREFGATFAVVFVDLDNFKDVNDKYGHDVGDEVLRLAVQRIKRRIRMDDVVIRMGGDEFLVILTGMGSDEEVIRNAVSRLDESLASEYRIGGHSISVTASLGVSLYPRDGNDMDLLLQEADRMMYTVKAEKRVAATSDEETTLQ